MVTTNNINSANPASVFRPFIPADVHLREFTLRAVVTGAVLGLIFGASSLYLVLKVGLTVSASIPVAVISLAMFRLWSKIGGRDATVLENNIVQTAGSAGESIAFGIGVTMPAILILGFDLELSRVVLVALLGGLLGILMMIPLRRALIVGQHGRLKYPEGTACAEVLKAGADAESAAVAARAGTEDLTGTTQTRTVHRPSAKAIFTGLGIGLVYKTLMSAFKCWKDIPEKIFGPPLKGGSISAEISPELLGVGYIIGPRIASIVMAGGAMSYLLFIPLIKFFGEGLSGPLPPGSVPISEMTPDQLRDAYILYIGAGAVAAGGIISLLRSLPIILHSVRASLSDFTSPRFAFSFMGARKDTAFDGVTKQRPRVEQDLSMRFVLGGIVILVVAILFAKPLHMNLLGALLIVIFGFLFVTVSSRLTGEIGSSSNPISGMTVATLLLTCLVFLIVGWKGASYYVTALSVGGIVCIAASNGGTTSQDLKTGYLLGATPKYQQIAILIGAGVSAFALGPILLGLNNSGTVYVPIAQVAPGLRAPADARFDKVEKLIGPQAKSDPRQYRVWHKTDSNSGPAGKYLVDDTGAAVWYVDPGINGVHKQRPDGTEVRKFFAPKATLMSYIIKGILGGELPLALVLFGVMSAIVLELCGVSSLAFAVGVYLPISSSSPIFVGGLVRWLVDRALHRELHGHSLDAAQLSAESDKSPGVLLASGYIAGGAIAGILIAFIAGAFTALDTKIANWMHAHNPFYAGRYSDVLALLPFAAIVLLLYLVGRGKLLAGQQVLR